MLRNNRFGIRSILSLLLSLAILPLSGMLVFHILSDRNERLALLYGEADQLGRLSASRVGATINSARQFLTALAHLKEIQALDPVKTGALLKDLAEHYPEYANIGVALPDGINIASVIPLVGVNDSSSQPWYARLQKQRDFVVGDYQIGKLTKKPGLNFAMPIPDSVDAHGLMGSVYLALNLSVLDEILTQAELPSDAAIAIVDVGQNILSRIPDPSLWRGKTQPAIGGTASGIDSRFMEGPGIDGKTRLYHTAVVPDSNGQLSIIIGFSKGQIERQTTRELTSGLLSLLGILAVVLALAGFLGSKVLIRPIIALSHAAERIGKGDFAAHAALTEGTRELSLLADSFNSMAESLRGNFELTQVWIDTMPSLVYRKNRQGVYLACNKALAEFWGKPVSEVLGKTVPDLADTETAAFHKAKDAELFSHPGTQTFETELKAADGRLMSVIFSKATYTDADGNVDGLVGVIVDISERKKIERQIFDLNRNLESTVADRTASFESANLKLREARKMLELVLDSIPSRVYWKDMEGRYLGCNRIFALDAGLETPQAIIGKTDEELQLAGDQLPHQGSDRSIMKDGWPLIGFEEILHPIAHSPRIVRTSKIPLFDSNNEGLGLLCVYDDITEQKNLTRDREFFFETAIDMVAIANLKGYFVQVSPSWTETLGWSAQELLSRPYIELVHPDDLASTNEAAGKLAEGVGVVGFDNRYRCKDGSWRWLSWRTSVSLEQGLAFAIARDITDSKAMEEALRTSERFMRTITDNIPGLLGYWNSDLRNEFANSAYREFFGKTPEQMTGMRMQDVLGPEVFAKNEPYIRAALAGKKEFFERTLVKVDGSVAYTWAQYLPDIDKGRVRGFFVLVTDITEIKSAQVQLEKLNVELKTQSLAIEKINTSLAYERDRLHRYLNLVDMVIVTFDASGSISMINRKGAELLGFTEEELIGKNWFETSLPPENEAAVKEVFERIMAGNLEAYEYFENEIQTKSGDRMLIAWHNNYFIDENGRIEGTISAGEDITQRKLAEEALRQAKEAAESANAAKSNFLANMSHEIRTPMNAILGFSEILGRLVEDSKQQEYLQAIRASGKTLLTLINDILDLSKIEAGGIELAVSAVNVRSLLGEVESIFSQKCGEKNITFRLDIPADFPEGFLLDGIRLRQILFNLVGNAVKFTDRGGIVLGVTCDRAITEKPSCRLCLDFFVRDTGIGISADQQERIFEPFTQHSGQVHAVYGGTGLGLSISRRLADVMNASLTVSSVRGEGSVFTLHFEDAEPALALADSGADRNKEEEFLFTACNVLVADDVAYNRELLVAMLNLPGLSVLAVKNGTEALEAIGREHPDIVLMDIRMPLLDGFETVRRIKGDRATSMIPVIAITASVLGEAEREARLAGFDAYLRKPIDRRELLHLMGTLLGEKAVKNTGSCSDTRLLPRNLIYCTDPEMLGIMEAEILPACDRLQSKLFVEEIRNLAISAEALALRFKDDALKNWAGSLKDRVVNYDTAGMKRVLAELRAMMPAGSDGDRRGSDDD